LVIHINIIKTIIIIIINTNDMTADKEYTFEPFLTDPPIVEAVPSAPQNSTESGQNPSDTAILVGCGLAGWVVGGPFLALLTALGGNWVKGKPGPIGESTRAIGRITEAAGKKAKDEHLWCKLKASIRSLFDGKKSRCETCEGTRCTDLNS
jgi:hypothetical protein